MLYFLPTLCLQWLSQVLLCLVPGPCRGYNSFERPFPITLCKRAHPAPLSFCSVQGATPSCHCPITALHSYSPCQAQLHETRDVFPQQPASHRWGAWCTEQWLRTVISWSRACGEGGGGRNQRFGISGHYIDQCRAGDSAQRWHGCMC